MTDQEWLATQFESQRSRLESVAFRMLGSTGEADDAVQEAWIRLARTDTTAVQNLGGWLTTVVARVCLDMLRSRKSRREDPFGDTPPAMTDSAAGNDPAREAEMADSVGLAMLVVLEALTPAERVAFVLHDMFDLPFDEIGPIVGREPAAARQLASRARRRVRGVEHDPDTDVSGQRRIVEAFLRAAREGDFEALLAVLDPDIVLHADAAAVAGARANAAAGAPPIAPEMHGAHAVATVFSGRAAGAQLALVGGSPGAVYAPGGVTVTAFAFEVVDGRVVGLSVVSNPVELAALTPVIVTS